jgi:kynurenine formamidase
MLICLSYQLSISSPLYPGTPRLEIAKYRSIESGDSANSSTVSFNVHSGTHIDAPRHFCPEGKTIAEALPYETRFRNTFCIDLPQTQGSCITADDLYPFITKIRNADAVFIKTGFCQIREMDPDRYRDDHPWIHPEVPKFLREKIPDIHLFGIDVISVSHPGHREQGHACHKSFLCGEHSILLLEDLDLRRLTYFHRKFDLILYPWIADGLDGVPVTALASIPK